MTEACSKFPNTTVRVVTQTLTGSVVVWMLCLLVVTDVIVRWQKPPDRTGDSYVAKFTNFLTSSRRSDVILLGSSIAFAASYYADTTIDNTLPKGKTDRSYSKALFIARQLSQQAGKEISVENLSSAGCMASDASLVLSKSIEFDKKPKLVIYEILERDLVDPSMLAPGETPYSRILAPLHAQAGRSWGDQLRAQLENFTNLPIFEQLKLALAPEESKAQLKKVEAVISSLWCYYKNRAGFLAQLQNHGENLFHRKLTLRSAVEAMSVPDKAAPQTASAACDLGPAQDINCIDWAPHRLRLAVERPYFIRLVKQCHDNDIPLVVVNMPVRKIYRQRLARDLKERYLETLKQECRRYNARFVDLADMPGLSDSDFLDQNHANCQGAPKIQRAAAGAIAAMPEIQARLRVH